MWWAYFDVSALLGELGTGRRATRATRANWACNAHPYAHLPLMIGIVLVALGTEEGAGVRRETARSTPWLESLWPPLSLAALVGGVALYLLAHVDVQAADRADDLLRAGW